MYEVVKLKVKMYVIVCLFKCSLLNIISNGGINIGIKVICIGIRFCEEIV